MSDVPPRVTLRRAAAADCRRLWEWRNEASVRAASFHSAPIPLEDHERWFASRLADSATPIFVVVTEDGRETGYVRFDMDGGEVRVSTAIAPEYRRRGYGPAAIQAAVQALGPVDPGSRVVALIRPDNRQSEAVFLRAGFVREGRRAVGGVTATVMEWRHG